MHQRVITAVGPDRPGLVDELTGHLAGAGANVADSRMVNLRGQFALILLVEGGPPSLSQTVVAAGGKMGLMVTVTDQPAPTSMRPGLPYRLRTYAMDRPGIVHRIAHLLYGHGVNIEEMQTHLQPGSYTSTPLFTMAMTLTVPPETQVKKLRTDLEQLCESLNCDVELEPA